MDFSLQLQITNPQSFVAFFNTQNVRVFKVNRSNTLYTELAFY